MIQMPKRSVTRFFIPLIDVLTLLFAMFLLLPIFEEAASADRPDDLASESETFGHDLEVARLTRQLREARQREATLRRQPGTAERLELERLRTEVARLRTEQSRPLTQRYAICVLGIDAKSGQLFYYDPSDANTKLVIDSAAKAHALIERQRKEAGRRDLYFLFQEPRVRSPFPIMKQRKDYEAWFRDVPHGYEAPGTRS